MKLRLFILAILSFLLLTPVFADDWDDFSAVDTMWDGQKSITNKEFEEVMDALQANEKQKEEKQRKKKIKKFGGGTSLHSDLNPDSEIKKMQGVKSKDVGILVNIPVNLLVDEKVLEKGFYNAIAEKGEDGKFYVLLYQSQFLIAKIEVVETEDDFGEDKLDFAKIIPHDDSFVKMIFGSIDFNAYVYIPYLN